jgi:hypothetical protein
MDLRPLCQQSGGIGLLETDWLIEPRFENCRQLCLYTRIYGDRSSIRILSNAESGPDNPVDRRSVVLFREDQVDFTHAAFDFDIQGDF